MNFLPLLLSQVLVAAGVLGIIWIGDKLRMRRESVVDGRVGGNSLVTEPTTRKRAAAGNHA